MINRNTKDRSFGQIPNNFDNHNPTGKATNIQDKRKKICVIQPVFNKNKDLDPNSLNAFKENTNPNIIVNCKRGKINLSRQSDPESSIEKHYVSVHSKQHQNDHENLVQYQSEFFRQDKSSSQQGKRVLYLKHKINNTQPHTNNLVKEQRKAQSSEVLKCGAGGSYNEFRKEALGTHKSPKKNSLAEQRKRSKTTRNCQPYEFGLENKHKNKLTLTRQSLENQKPFDEREEDSTQSILDILPGSGRQTFRQQNQPVTFQNDENRLFHRMLHDQIIGSASFCFRHPQKKAKYYIEQGHKTGLCAKCAVMEISQGGEVFQIVEKEMNENIDHTQRRKQKIIDLIETIDIMEPKVVKAFTNIEQMENSLKETVKLQQTKIEQYYNQLIDKITEFKNLANEKVINSATSFMEVLNSKQQTLKVYLQDLCFMREDIIPNIDQISDQKLVEREDFYTIMENHHKKLDIIDRFEKNMLFEKAELLQIHEKNINESYNKFMQSQLPLSLRYIQFSELIEHERKSFSFDQIGWVDTNKPSPVFKKI